MVPAANRATRPQQITAQTPVRSPATTARTVARPQGTCSISGNNSQSSCTSAGYMFIVRISAARAPARTPASVRMPAKQAGVVAPATKPALTRNTRRKTAVRRTAEPGLRDVDGPAHGPRRPGRQASGRLPNGRQTLTRPGTAASRIAATARAPCPTTTAW